MGGFNINIFLLYPTFADEKSNKLLKWDKFGAVCPNLKNNNLKKKNRSMNQNNPSETNISTYNTNSSFLQKLFVSHINHKVFSSGITSSKGLINDKITKVLPRNVVILHGKKHDMKSLEKSLAAESYNDTVIKIKLLKKGQEVDLNPESTSYKVKLDKYILKPINTINLLDKISKIKGWIKTKKIEFIKKIKDRPSNHITNKKVKKIHLSDEDTGQKFLVGNIWLSDIQIALLKKGLKIKYTSNGLHCIKAKVIIKYTDLNIISIPLLAIYGSLSNEYFKIKNIIYKLKE